MAGKMLGLAAAFAATIGATAANASQDPAFGYWLVENRKAVVAIEPCGAEACGRIVWLAEPLGPNGRVKTDRNNPDPSLRTRPLCGLPLISELKRSDAGEWTDGAIYNGRDGSVYDLQIRAEGADRLEVRGYLGISLLGKSQTWERVTHDRGGCGPERTATR